ncbi:hypothetical protein BDV06DRAFT_232058 [Aspergillus oleicola]
MREPTHIIDPEGDAIIVLSNANAPFAQFECDLFHQKVEGNDMKKSRNAPSPSHVPEPVEVPVKVPTEASVEAELASRFADDASFRIQVSAKHLILASLVFKKILTGGWKESAAYQQKGFVEIKAESWDIDALMILLRAVHGQLYDIPHKLTLEMLAKVAVLADYYDCRQTLFVYKDIWIEALEEPVPPNYSQALVLWIWVAWFFQLPAQFKEATSNAMTRSHGFISNLRLPIPANVMDPMNDSRQRSIGAMINQFHDTLGALLSGSQGCCWECSSIMYGALSKNLALHDLLSPKPEAPFPGQSYEDLIVKVLFLPSPCWTSQPRRKKRHSCSFSSFNSLFGAPPGVIEGLDLHTLIPH